MSKMRTHTIRRPPLRARTPWSNRFVNWTQLLTPVTTASPHGVNIGIPKLKLLLKFKTPNSFSIICRRWLLVAPSLFWTASVKYLSTWFVYTAWLCALVKWCMRHRTSVHKFSVLRMPTKSDADTQESFWVSEWFQMLIVVRSPSRLQACAVIEDGFEKGDAQSRRHGIVPFARHSQFQ